MGTHWSRIEDVLDDPALAKFVRLVASTFNTGYRGRIYFVPATQESKEDGGSLWTCLPPNQPWSLNLVAAAHLLAGFTDEPQRIGKVRNGYMNVVGLGVPPDEMLSYLNLDLDGGGSTLPAAVVAALRERFSPESVLVTRSSQREGRYRALLRLATPCTPAELADRATGLIHELGFPVVSGQVEIFPALKNSRLPFGRWGCVRLVDDALRHGVREHPADLLDRLLAAPAVELPTALPCPALDRPTARATAVARRSAATPVTPVAPVRTAVTGEVARLWASGVATGERDAAIWTLAGDLQCRGVDEQTAVERLQDWIRGGGIAHSRAARSRRGLAAELRDIPRRMRDRYSRAPRLRLAILPPVNLTAREIQEALAISRRVAEGTGGSDAPGHSAASVFALLYAVLPLFKAHVLARRPTIVLHFTRWVRLAGWGVFSLRAASGIFRVTRTHRSRLQYGLGARAAGWRVDFDFERSIPRGPVIPATWRPRRNSKISPSARSRSADRTAKRLLALAQSFSSKQIANDARRAKRQSRLPACP